MEAADCPEDKSTIKRFVEDPRNKVRSCRNIHAVVLDALPIPLPPLEYMRDFLEAGKNGT